VPKRPRSRHRPAARKKARRRLDIPVTAAPHPDAPAAAPAAASAPARVIPFPPARAAAPSRAPARLAHADYSYVKREIRRIAVLAAGVVVLLIVLSFVLG